MQDSENLIQDLKMKEENKGILHTYRRVSIQITGTTTEQDKIKQRTTW